MAADEKRRRYVDVDSIDGCAEYRHIRRILEQNRDIFAQRIPANALRNATDLIWSAIRFGEIGNWK